MVAAQDVSDCSTACILQYYHNTHDTHWQQIFNIVVPRYHGDKVPNGAILIYVVENRVSRDTVTVHGPIHGASSIWMNVIMELLVLTTAQYGV